MATNRQTSFNADPEPEMCMNLVAVRLFPSGWFSHLSRISHKNNHSTRRCLSTRLSTIQNITPLIQLTQWTRCDKCDNANIPVSDVGASPATVGLPLSAQYAQVILNKPQVSPLHVVVRLHPEIASQMHPKQVCVTGASCAPEIKNSSPLIIAERFFHAIYVQP